MPETLTTSLYHQDMIEITETCSPSRLLEECGFTRLLQLASETMQRHQGLGEGWRWGGETFNPQRQHPHPNLPPLGQGKELVAD